MNLVDNARFFLIYPMHLEDLGRIELETKFSFHFAEVPLTIVDVIPGGIEIECPMHVGFNLNRILRTPTRILLRLAEFKCRDFPKLYQKMSKFPWHYWMIGQTPEVECASKNSRLFDSRKIEKAIQDGVNQFYRHKPVKKRYLDHLEILKGEHLPKIYFRVEDDHCTLSIDTTGERLHLRGEKLLTGLAPIRENLAALLLTEFSSHLKESSYTLIDPMAGSGTFLLEAKRSNNVTIARDYAFLHMPIAIDSAALFAREFPENKKTIFDEFVGFDINSEIVELAKTNVPDIQFAVEDVFSDKIHNMKNPVVIMNPPYGIRVGTDITLDFFLRIIESIKKKFRPQLLGMIVPADFKLKSSKSFHIIKSRPFKNGGIDVVFYVITL